MDALQGFLTGIVTSEAGAAFISLIIASFGATIVSVFWKNEDEDAPSWRKYVGMFLRGLAGAVGENTTKKSIR